MPNDVISLIAAAVVVVGWAYFLTRGWPDRRVLVFNIVILTALTTLLIWLPAGSHRTVAAIAAVLILIAQLGLNELTRRRTNELETTLTELARREERLGQVASIAKLGYYVYDTIAERIVECTEQHARNHGLGLDEYLEHASTLSNEMPLVHPADRLELARAYQRALAGEAIEASYRVPLDDGREIHIKEITRPIFDEAGRVVGELGATMDVTEQVETQRQFLISQRLETSGRVAAGVAHDFNNLLAVILVSLELLELETGPGSARHIDAAVEAVARGRELARGLLGFTGHAEMVETVVDLNPIVMRVANMGRSLMPPTIAVDTSTDAELWSVVSDPGLTENAVLNLLLNARDAMPDGGRLRLATANVEIDADQSGGGAPDVVHTGVVAPGRYVRLSVADTGIGIEAEELAHVFEPFYSSKREVGGSGLGLSMVKGFLDQIGGRVEVSSRVGVGTEFRLLFPVSDLASPVPDRTVVQPSTPTQTDPPLRARVLVADDDPLVLEVVTTLLTDQGHVVESTASGDDAYRVFESDPAFDLVITDIVMPGSRDGKRLARDLRAIRPEIPVIFISGYSPEPADDADEVRLQKPFHRVDLLQAVAHSLAKA